MCNMPHSIYRKQHQADIRRKTMSNGIFKHLKENKQHKVDWENPIILDNEKHWMRRKIKESLYINICNKSRQITKIMNIEKGLEIDECWKSITNHIPFATMISDRQRLEDENENAERVLEIEQN